MLYDQWRSRIVANAFMHLHNACEHSLSSADCQNFVTTPNHGPLAPRSFLCMRCHYFLSFFDLSRAAGQLVQEAKAAAAAATEHVHVG
jgi:hypothetical protein